MFLQVPVCFSFSEKNSTEETADKFSARTRTLSRIRRRFRKNKGKNAPLPHNPYLLGRVIV